MNIEQFRGLVAESQQPVILDIWAPWCGPCKAMKPHFDQLSGEFSDSARVVAINADESPEVARELGIASIPTVLVYRGGTEVARRIGAQSAGDLRNLFEAAVAGRSIPRLTNRTRFLRIAAAALFAGLAGELDPSWPMWIAAAGMFMLAVHDRCPLLQMLRGRMGRAEAA